MQALLSMIERASRLEGIAAPGPSGRGQSSVRFSAFADDLMLYLRSFAELATIKELMDTFERASGAATNWGKTVGIRVGTAQGVHTA